MKRQKNITLDIEVIERITDYAQRDGRPFSSYINKVLKDHLQRLDSQRPCTPPKEP